MVIHVLLNIDAAKQHKAHEEKDFSIKSLLPFLIEVSSFIG